MIADPIAAAIDHIRRITPSNDSWTAPDIADEQQEPDEVEESIATILNAAVDGQLISRHTLAVTLDTERAKVAAAYEATASIARSHIYYDSIGSGFREDEFNDAIRALTPADAQAALGKMLTEVWRDGWRAGRDAAYDACREWMRNDACRE